MTSPNTDGVVVSQERYHELCEAERKLAEAQAQLTVYEILLDTTTWGAAIGAIYEDRRNRAIVERIARYYKYVRLLPAPKEGK